MRMRAFAFRQALTMRQATMHSAELPCMIGSGSSWPGAFSRLQIYRRSGIVTPTHAHHPSSRTILGGRTSLDVMHTLSRLAQGARRGVGAPNRCHLALLMVLGSAVAAAETPAPAKQVAEGTPGYQIVSAVVAGGGISRAQNACFELAATAGQPVVGTSANSTYTLVAGFWGAAVQGDTLFRSSFEACQP